MVVAAWSERDVAQLREKKVHIQMYTLREKLEKLEADVQKAQTIDNDE